MPLKSAPWGPVDMTSDSGSREAGRSPEWLEPGTGPSGPPAGGTPTAPPRPPPPAAGREPPGTHPHGIPRAGGGGAADRLALAAAAVGRVEAAVHAGRRDPVAAVRARVVAEAQRRDHRVAFLDLAPLGAGVLDDAYELVADRTGLERR